MVLLALVSDVGLTTACSGRRCAPPLMLSVRHTRATDIKLR
jgi:hypothetical protein